MASINGFAISSNKSAIGIKTYKVPGTTTSLPVRSEIAPLLIGLAAEFHRKVEPLHKGWCWGYAYRAVRGASKPSFHAGGLAIDLNAPRHPLGKRNTFNAKQRATCRALAKKYGCRWGGDYTGRKDEMHFEVIVPRARAVSMARALQRKSASPGKLTVDGRPGPSTYVALQKAVGAAADGMMGPTTWRLIQRRVGAKVDGTPDTETYKAIQRRVGVKPADGKMGPSTWKALQTALNNKKF